MLIQQGHSNFDFNCQNSTTINLPPKFLISPHWGRGISPLTLKAIWKALEIAGLQFISGISLEIREIFANSYLWHTFGATASENTAFIFIKKLAMNTFSCAFFKIYILKLSGYFIR